MSDAGAGDIISHVADDMHCEWIAFGKRIMVKGRRLNDFCVKGSELCPIGGNFVVKTGGGAEEDDDVPVPVPVLLLDEPSKDNKVFFLKETTGVDDFSNFHGQGSFSKSKGKKDAVPF